MKMYPAEKQFANLLDKQKREWQFPTSRFRLDNTTYRPDFFLPKENLYIEVVGTRQAFHSNKNKIIQFKRLYPHIKFIIVDFHNNPFPLIKKVPKTPSLKMIKYFDIMIPYKPGHISGRCGSNPKLCETCKAIRNYWQRKDYQARRIIKE